MNTSDSESLITKMTGVPSSRIHWVKSPIVTQIKVKSIDDTSPFLPIAFTFVEMNRGNGETQVTGMPTPDHHVFRVYSEGKEIPQMRPTKGQPKGYTAPPSDKEIISQTQKVKSGWTYSSIRKIALGGFQLFHGTHVYEVVYWQSHLNWIDVRNFIDKTDSQGRLGYPITDNAPSNRLYFKVYMPTEEEAREGKSMKFLGEVDAKTQIPQFPITRPGDFAHKTGYWRAEGGGIEALGGEHVVFVKEGESMPNLPGDVGFDPFAFQWRFLRE